MDVAQQSISPMLAAQSAAAEGPQLQLTGDLGLVAAIVLALVLGGLSWWLYRRDLRGRTGAMLFLLPLLRVLVVLMLVTVLTGPTLVRKRHVGTVAHLMLFVDGSGSMTTTDEQMEMGRKLRLAANLGWINGAAAEDHARRLRDQFAQAMPKAESLRFLVNPDDVKTGIKGVQELIADAGVHLGKLTDTQLSAARRQALKKELLDPVAALDLSNPMTARDQIVQHQVALQRWKTELDQLVTQNDAKATNKIDPATLQVLKRFDKTPRWERVQPVLLGGEESLFERLTLDHQVSLSTLTSNTYRTLWQSQQRGDKAAPELPKTFGFGPEMTNVLSTDLVTGIEQALAIADVQSAKPAADGFQKKLFVVLFTDGQHNTRPNPVEMARRLGQRQVPMHIVGVGTTRQPMDLAIQKVDAPVKVLPNTQLNGRVIVQDGMPPGKPFTVTIEHKGKPVWTQDLMTTEGGQREIPFDFPIEDIVNSEKQIKNTDLQFSNLPLVFDVKIKPIEGEINPDNNTAKLRTSVVTQKARVLLIDGRPRWEYRYINSLFERDERWEIDSLLPDQSGSGGFGARGQRRDQFPDTRERLFSYQLIIFGDISPQLFRPQELQWLREFVQFNAGGMIFIDGHYERLASYNNSPLQPLFPVTWPGAQDYKSLSLAYRPLTDEAALQLAPDAKASADIWAGFSGPRRIVPCEKLPGADVLLEVTEQNAKLPALVFRRFGSGRVLYSAFDESWRWRQDVGDKYHEKFWKQTAKMVMEEPFAVMDRFLAIDTGPPYYEEGDRAQIRVRMRDPAAMAWLEANKAKPVAMLYQGDKLVAQVPLDPDFQSALYRGFSEPLKGGEYEVRVRVPGVPDDQLRARTQFTVASVATGEMGILYCHEKQLRQMAADSGGRYYAEEDMAQLAEVLKPFSSGETIIEEEKLWQSYWTFLPIILLLTLEWTLRKRAGLL